MKRSILTLLLLLITLPTLLFAQEGDNTGDVEGETSEIRYEPAPEELQVEPEVSFEELLTEAGKFYNEEEYFKALASLDRARQLIKLKTEEIKYDNEDDLNMVIKERESQEGRRIRLKGQFVGMSGNNSFTVFHRQSFNKFEVVFDSSNGDISRQILQLSRRQLYYLMGRVGFDEEGKFILYLERVEPFSN